MPDLPHDARPVELAGRRADPGVHPRADRGRATRASGIKKELVAQFGPAILAAPPHKGFGLLAWWLPIAGLLAGLAAITFGVWHWSRSREPAGPAPPPAALEPELERRVDEELARLDA